MKIIIEISNEEYLKNQYRKLDFIKECIENANNKLKERNENFFTNPVELKILKPVHPYDKKFVNKKYSNTLLANKNK